jgi:hypothetical protein
MIELNHTKTLLPSQMMRLGPSDAVARQKETGKSQRAAFDSAENRSCSSKASVCRGMLAIPLAFSAHLSLF